MSSDVFGLTPESWIAIGSIATSGGFLVAGIGALIAARQLLYSKQPMIDQRRPYVVVTFEPGLAEPSLADISIRNLGAGPARDVRISVEPPLRRAKEIDGWVLAETRYFNEDIASMPPGYQMRTFFDSMAERKDAALPSRYTFTISYHDGHGHRWAGSELQLNWGQFQARSRQVLPVVHWACLTLSIAVHPIASTGLLATSQPSTGIDYGRHTKRQWICSFALQQRVPQGTP